MILTPNDLPSKGLYSNAGPLYLRPLSFLEMIEYTNEVTGNSIKDCIRDLKWLIRLDSSVKDHSLFDLDYLIFMMKVHTISDNKDFVSNIKCPVCGTDNRIEIDLGDFKFVDAKPKDELIKRVVLGGTKFHIGIPTIGEFMDVLNTYSIYQKTDKVEIPKLVSLFPEFKTIPNVVENAIFNSTRKDISILYMLETNYLSTTEPIKRTCAKCDIKGGMAIGISSLIADMFRNVLFNCPVNESDVQFE